jgi:hypothetical protein
MLWNSNRSCLSIPNKVSNREKALESVLTLHNESQGFNELSSISRVTNTGASTPYMPKELMKYYIIIFALAMPNKSSTRQKGNLMCGVKTALRAARLGINFHQRR